MATFTVEFRDALAYAGCSVQHMNGRTILRGGSIGLEHYPIFDEDYRDTLNGLIVDHFWTREIGHETVSLFSNRLRSTMNLEMPTFNRMYLAALEDVGALSTMRVDNVSRGTSKTETETAGESENTATSKAGSRSVFSDTPQTMLAGNEDYASNATDNNSTSDNAAMATESGTSDTNSESEGSNTTHGYQGHAGELIRRYQESLVNVDRLVIATLEPLFMGIWETGDSYGYERL